MACRFVVVAGFADSLVLFRGVLIREMIARGVEVHAAAPDLASSGPTRVALERMGVRLHDIPLSRAGKNPLRDLWLAWRLYRLMRCVRPKRMLGYTVKPVVYGVIAASLARVPERFAMIEGLGYAFTDGRGGALRWLISHLYGFALTRTSKVFFLNPDDRALFVKEGVVPESVPTVLLNGTGVDLDWYARAPLPLQHVRFLMVCRLLGDKGVREYAEAARRVRANNPAAHFTLAGWIDENPDSITQEELDGWIADGRIEYLGKLADVRPALAACTVYVLPSYREGTPRTVLEAMSTGRPIITTDAPGCRETVEDGRNGFLIPVKSVDALVTAMRKFLDDPSLAARMGQESRKIAESKYDVHKVNEVMLREMGFLETTAADGAPHE